MKAQLHRLGQPVWNNEGGLSWMSLHTEYATRLRVERRVDAA